MSAKAKKAVSTAAEELANNARARDETAAVWAPLSELTAWEQNPRINDAAVEPVMDSIRRFGFAAPIVARMADGMVIAGHTRLKAAMALGLDRVPVRYMDLDPAEARLLALADNRLGEKATWDMEALRAALEEVSAEDTSLVGWSSEDLDKLADGLAASSIDIESAFGAVPEGDKEPFQQMAFMLHEDQLSTVSAAIDLAKKRGPFEGPNTNANANALERICKAYVG